MDITLKCTVFISLNRGRSVRSGTFIYLVKLPNEMDFLTDLYSRGDLVTSIVP